MERTKIYKFMKKSFSIQKLLEFEILNNQPNSNIYIHTFRNSKYPYLFRIPEEK